MNKKIFMGFTDYQLLIFLLLIDSKDKVEIFLSKILEHRYKKLNKYFNIIQLEQDYRSGFSNYINYYLYLKKIMFRLEINKNDIIYGDNTIAFLLDKSQKIYRLEDGLRDYLIPEKELDTFLKKIKFILNSIIYFIIFRKRRLSEKEKLLKRSNKIFLTGLASIPNEIKNKVEIINLELLWKKKTDDEKNKILDIYGLKNNIFEELGRKKIILFTQPLSEDKIITEEEKIYLYSKILEKYPKEDLIIKTHPRERTEYNKYFKEYLIIQEKIPFEIFTLLGVKFEKSVTIYSSAALNCGKDVQIDFYGTEVSENIFNKVGSCDKIMRRNVFL